ncbi:MAG: LacI family DNA-binding transcriptional regulator [Chloroflexi bacterium]|nr:LacI family DNA-binding transcriptional regulator [Chloroflexota bacterium]
MPETIRVSASTIRDVAREARVAVSTVSRVLNESGAAAEPTRKRVLDAVARLGYRPSGAAQSLRKGRTMTIGVLLPDLANPVFVSYLRGAERMAETHGYSVFTCDGQDSAEAERRGLLRLYERRVDGLLLGGPVSAASIDLFCDAGIPVEPFLPGQREAPFPRAALEEGATLTAFRSLLRLGHRRVAFFSRQRADSLASSGVSSFRYEILRHALAESGVTRDETLNVVTGADHCRAEVQRLAALAQPPTAYVAGSHVLAAPLLSAIYDAGLSIPHEVSFISFGDSPWAVAHRPPISVVRFDYAEEARCYMQRLVARIEGRADIPEVPRLPSEFVPRGSCAKAAP